MLKRAVRAPSGCRGAASIEALFTLPSAKIYRSGLSLDDRGDLTHGKIASIHAPQ